MLEGYITPLLMSYIDKYVKNIKPSDLKLSFWGGDAVLHNLDLRLDVLERELRIPVEFKSGCIRELTLHIPWNAIGSSSVEVSIKDLEFVVKLKPLLASSSSEHTLNPESPPKSESATQEKISKSGSSSSLKNTPASDKEPPAPGYLQGYLNRIINNVKVHIQNIVVKVMHEESDLMLTLNIGSIEYFTANDHWEREFVYTDYFQDSYSLHKALRVSDMTVNLHPIEIREKNQGSLLHEPFVNRLTFMCRMKFEYQEKVSVRKTWEVVIDAIEFSVDENQFCLFLHFLDWLVAVYYSGKKLKGRDENPYQSSLPHQKPGDLAAELPTSVEPDKSGSGVDQKALELNTGSKAGSGTDVDSVKEGTQQDSVGWGSWLLSYIGPTDSEEFPDEEATILSKMETSKDTKQKPAEFRFIMNARSVVIVMKMTQQVQVPVYRRSFTSPVLRVVFNRCMLRVDKSPLTQLFLVCMGVGGVRSEVMGLCPCVKKFPSSWRRTNAASIADGSKLVRRNT